MNKAPVIGIDLGTSFSAAAVFLDAKQEAIPNKEGHRITPSFVFYNEETSGISVGTSADHLGIRCITNFFYDAKRIIGRKYNDANVQKIKNNEHYRFNITNDPEGNAVFKLTHDGKLAQKSPEEVSSEVLKYLKESANVYLGTEIKEAVISIPAHFSNSQRRATRKAAELAGLKVLRLITEPVAGALFYIRGGTKVDGKVLVYDFGGGTFDVSIIDVKDKEINVLNVEGETFLGGRDMDQLLVEHFMELLKKKYGDRILTSKLMRRLKEKCIVLKEKLSIQDFYYITLECVDGNDEDFTLRMSRTRYEEIIADLVEKSMIKVKKCIGDLNIPPKDITNVLLIGGVTRTPMIQQKLSRYFGSNKLKSDVNPDEAVALGAAYQAALLTGQCNEIRQITEVTPLSLGVTVSNGLVLKVIEKGTKLPTEKYQTIRTLFNNQSSMKIEISEGERKNRIYNNVLDEFDCIDLPEGKAGDVQITVTFILDNDGILKVEAEVLATGKKKKVNIELQEPQVRQSDIKRSIEDAEKNKKDDDLFEAFENIYSNVIILINRIQYELENINRNVDQEFVKNICFEFETYIKNINYRTPLEEILNKYKAFKTSVERLVVVFNMDVLEPLMSLEPMITEAIEKFS
ncbi:chaperone protein DnaK-like [Rhynchophorus ferrugineus]|uniref:chaperone protein DnaK-like n=1 Tax=Rhynchophorus ferrugineus TaxID=354439 RepID=UPI003FCDB76D